MEGQVGVEQRKLILRWSLSTLKAWSHKTLVSCTGMLMAKLWPLHVYPSQKMGDRFFVQLQLTRPLGSANISTLCEVSVTTQFQSCMKLERGARGSTLYCNNQFKFRFVITSMTRTRMLGAVLVILNDVPEVWSIQARNLCIILQQDDEITKNPCGPSKKILCKKIINIKLIMIRVILNILGRLGICDTQVKSSRNKIWKSSSRL